MDAATRLVPNLSCFREDFIYAVALMCICVLYVTNIHAQQRFCADNIRAQLPKNECFGERCKLYIHLLFSRISIKMDLKTQNFFWPRGADGYAPQTFSVPLAQTSFSAYHMVLRSLLGARPHSAQVLCVRVA